MFRLVGDPRAPFKRNRTREGEGFVEFGAVKLGAPILPEQTAGYWRESQACAKPQAGSMSRSFTRLRKQRARQPINQQHSSEKGQS